MPDVMIEMHSGPSINRNNTTSGSVAEGAHWASTTTGHYQAGARLDFPRWNADNDSSIGSAPKRTFPTGSTAPSSENPPSYKEVVFGESDAIDSLLPKPAQWAQPPQETQSGPRSNMSSLPVTDPLPLGAGAFSRKATAEESADPMILIRVLIMVGVIAGIGLCLWEVAYQKSLSSSPHWQERKQKGLRAGFGGLILGFAVVCYFCDAFTNATFKAIYETRTEEPPEHLRKMPPTPAKPKITWYMKCFHRDIHSIVVTNPDGSLRTVQRNDQVEAWSGLQEFQYSTWENASDPMEERGAINRFTFHKKFTFANEETRASFEAQKQAFIAANKHRDQEFTVEEIFEIEGFRTEATVASASGFCLTNFCVYLFMTFSFLLYPWLCILNGREAYFEYTHVIKVSV